VGRGDGDGDVDGGRDVEMGGLGMGGLGKKCFEREGRMCRWWRGEICDCEMGG